MKKKSVITLAILMVLTTGCSKSNKEQKTSTGKIAFQEMYSVVFDSLKKSYDKDVEKKDDKKTDSHKKKAEASKSDDSKKEKNSTSGKSSNEKPITKQETSSQQLESESSSGNNTQSNPQKEPPKQQTAQPPKQEQPKPESPAKPVTPKPSPPACNNTLPAGAYPVAQESEVCEKVEAEMTENQLHGDGTFNQYEIEYGYTECGTKYFYIIRIYS